MSLLTLDRVSKSYGALKVTDDISLSVDEGQTLGILGPNGAGPALFGLLGRPAGSAPAFTYSAPFITAMKGRVWDATLLGRWLTDTQTVAPGNGMSYFEDDKKKRAEIIRYIQTLK